MDCKGVGREEVKTEVSTITEGNNTVFPGDLRATCSAAEEEKRRSAPLLITAMAIVPSLSKSPANDASKSASSTPAAAAITCSAANASTIQNCFRVLPREITNRGRTKHVMHNRVWVWGWGQEFVFAVSSSFVCGIERVESIALGAREKNSVSPRWRLPFCGISA